MLRCGAFSGSEEQFVDVVELLGRLRVAILVAQDVGWLCVAWLLRLVRKS